MRHFRLLRSTTLAAVAAVTVAGCGLGPDPAVSTPDEAIDALLALRDGAQVRVTADLDLEQGELRDVLREDPEALELFREAVDGEGTDVDGLLTDLEEARDALADHAVLLATGADGSSRVAAEYQSSVWADLRRGSDLAASEDPTDDFRFDLQLQVDWATAAAVFDEPDLLGDLDEAAAALAPYLGELPELAPVQELVLALLGSELVGIRGELTPGLLGGLGLSGKELSAVTGPGSVLGPGALDLRPRQLAETAFDFRAFRRDGDATLVDVTIEVRALGELVLDQLAETPDAVGMSFDDVEELLGELPERLVDIATLRLDDEGTLQQVRVDLLDAALQLAQAAEPDDEDLATVLRVAGELEATGLFLLLDVERLGEVQTVLGDPRTAVTPQQLADAFGALALGGLAGGLDLGALGPEQPGDGTGTTGSDVFDRGLQPGDVAAGDCFDDAALVGVLEPGTSPTVPCEQSHDNEAFAVVPADAGSYEELTRAEIDAMACIEAFAGHVGVPYAESELVVDVIRPTSAAFDAGVRESVCYLYGSEPLTGSAAGSGR